MRIYRMILPVSDIEAASRFYGTLLGIRGERVTTGRHYFNCEGVLLTCWDPIADGDLAYTGPNPGSVYLSTNESLERVRQRAIEAGARLDPARGRVAPRPWGEVSFYASDPWRNPFCVVASGTEYRGGAINPPTGTG